MSKSPDLDILNTVYQSAVMGSNGVEGLLERTEDAKFRDALSDQLAEYKRFQALAEEQLKQRNEEPEGAGAIKQAMGKMGIRMNTAIDKSSSHMAEMMIEGSTMGITDLQSILNSNRDAMESTQRLCSSFIHQEQCNIDRMKGFLGHTK